MTTHRGNHSSINMELFYQYKIKHKLINKANIDTKNKWKYFYVLSKFVEMKDID